MSTPAKKIFYIANARMPTEKAHGIQIAKMSEAFIEEGVSLELIVPNRKTEPASIQEFYGLRVPIPVHRLWAADWYAFGRLGFSLGSLVFMVSCVAYLWVKWLAGERFVLYTVDMDTFSSSMLALVPGKLFTEMHTGKPVVVPQRILFRKLSGVITINRTIRDELQSRFPNTHTKYLIEPNGVDQSHFVSIPTQEARSVLGIPQDARIALYVGRFFAWKGLETIVRAAGTPSGQMLTWYILGGSKESFAEVVKEPIPDNILFPGSVPHSQVPRWLSAADVLLVLGTKQDTQSYWYTSPMKLFEYLVAKRPIVASRTPAIESIVSDKEVLFYAPDDADDLAAKANEAARFPNEARITAAYEMGGHYSWKGRAARILQFVGMRRGAQIDI